MRAFRSSLANAGVGIIFPVSLPICTSPCKVAVIASLAISVSDTKSDVKLAFISSKRRISFFWQANSSDFQQKPDRATIHGKRPLT